MNTSTLTLPSQADTLAVLRAMNWVDRYTFLSRISVDDAIDLVRGTNAEDRHMVLRSMPPGIALVVVERAE